MPPEWKTRLQVMSEGSQGPTGDGGGAMTGRTESVTGLPGQEGRWLRFASGVSCRPPMAPYNSSNGVTGSQRTARAGEGELMRRGGRGRQVAPATYYPGVCVIRVLYICCICYVSVIVYRVFQGM